MYDEIRGAFGGQLVTLSRCAQLVWSKCLIWKPFMALRPEIQKLL